MKVQFGRLTLPDDPKRYVPDRMRSIGVEPLPVQHTHALGVGDLPPLHRDPFDRLLVAQARDLHLRIVTADEQIARYEVETLLV
ncbi:MAG: type II toxin-antitoxin system VapC family toxin [Nocardioidaceae bacterium]